MNSSAEEFFFLGNGHFQNNITDREEKSFCYEIQRIPAADLPHGFVASDLFRFTDACFPAEGDGRVDQ